MTYLKCPQCELIQTIHRGASRRQAAGHIKHMWCPTCQQVVGHEEMPDGE